MNTYKQSKHKSNPGGVGQSTHLQRTPQIGLIPHPSHIVSVWTTTGARVVVFSGSNCAEKKSFTKPCDKPAVAREDPKRLIEFVTELSVLEFKLLR